MWGGLLNSQLTVMYLYIEGRNGETSNETLRDADPDELYDRCFWIPFQIPAHVDKISSHTKQKPPKKYPHPPSTMKFQLSKKTMILCCLISSTSNLFSKRRPNPPVPSQLHSDDLPAAESLPMPPSAPRGRHSRRILGTFVRRTRSRL